MIAFALQLTDVARAKVAEAALPYPETKPDRGIVTATDRRVEDLLSAVIATAVG